MIPLIADCTLRSMALGLCVFIVLKALRVRDPRLERTIWRVVLLAAALMPALLKLGSLAPLPGGALSARYAEIVHLSVSNPTSTDVDIWLLAALAISGILMIRHLIGITRCWRMRERAARLQTACGSSLDVRISTEVTSPATVFSTILVPQDFARWSAKTQQLAIAHERSHLVSRDFYVQWLAQGYRNLLWFNPFAWWLAARLALLNEHVSDDAAIASCGARDPDERASYARVLVALARRCAVRAEFVPMIRAHALSLRIEHILQPTRTRRAGAGARGVLGCTLLVLLAASVIPTPAEHEHVANTHPSHASRSNRSAQVVLPKSIPSQPLSQPRYPAASRRLGETGTVVLKLQVLEDGSVADAAIEKSTGHPQLDHAAYDESLRWRLAPGTIDGTPARMWGRFAVTFTLAQD